MIEPPVISVFQSAADLFYLVATSYERTMPAGPRLFRGAPHPDIKFTHTMASEAQKHASMLQEYINDRWGDKMPSKAKLRKMA